MAQVTTLVCDFEHDGVVANAAETITLQCGKRKVTFDACEDHARPILHVLETMRNGRGSRGGYGKSPGTKKGAKLHGGKYLSTQEAAEHLGVTSAMIQKAYNQGRLPLSKKKGRANYFRVSDIEALRR